MPSASDGSAAFDGPHVGATGVVASIKRFFSSQVDGAHAAELRAARSELVLSRVVALVWVGCFMMPFAIFLFVGVVRPERLLPSIAIVGAAEVAIFVLRALVKRGVFARSPQLAPFLLVGCVYGPVASAICELVHGHGDFFFSYFLIAIAFITLFPVDVGVVIAICVALGVSYASAVLVRPTIAIDREVATNLLYIVDVAVLAIVFNRILTALFLDERRARIELRAARDTLLGEMAVAHQIQSLLLPAKDVAVSRHAISGMMKPADEVGGDYYDVIDMGHRRFFAIGDVSGHGVTSGLMMMMARSCLVGSLAAKRDAPLFEMYQALNAGLRANLARMKSAHFMTFALIEDLGDGRYEAIGAHLPLLIWRKQRRAIEEQSFDGMWLGLLDEIPASVLTTSKITLAAGDQMLLYTDGIVESFRNGEMFGFERLRDTFEQAAEGGPAEAVAAILREVLAYNPRLEDDVTLLAIEYTGEVENVAAVTV